MKRKKLNKVRQVVYMPPGLRVRVIEFADAKNQTASGAVESLLETALKIHEEQLKPEE